MSPSDEGMRVEPTSMTEVLRALDDQSDRVAKQNLAAAVRKAMMVIRDAARSLVRVVTGLLKSAIDIVTFKSDRRVAIVDVGINDAIEGTDSEGRKRWPIKYAHLEELGTVHSRARPFLRPAFDSNEDRAFDIFADEMARRVFG